MTGPVALPQQFAAGIAVRLPQWVEINTDSGEAVAPATAVFELQFLTTAAAGNTITITWPRASVTMTGVASLSLDDTGTQFSTLFGTAGDLVNALWPRLQLNYYLQRDFIITRPAADTVRFTARAIGLAYQPTVVATNPPTLAAHTEITYGQDGGYFANHGVRLVLEVEREHNTGIYHRLPELRADRAPNGNLRWNISPLLLPYLGINWPAYGTTGRLHAKDIVRRVRAWYYERQGAAPQPRILNQLTTSINKVWYAGSRLREQAAFEAELLNLDIYDAAGSRFLTYRGRPGERHEVSPGQQHYLGFYDWGVNYAIEDDFELNLRVYYTDGTNSTKVITYPYADGQPGPGEISIYPTGFNVQGLGDLQPAKTPYKYEAWLTTDGSGTTRISATHTFWLVAEDANERHLEFVNSFGCIESARLVGSWENGLELSFQEAGFPRAIDNGTKPDTQQLDVVNIGNTTTEVLQLSSGFMDRGELLALLDLLYSPQLRLVDHERSTRVGCRLLNTSHIVRRQGAEDEHLYALNLELEVGDPDRATSQVKAWTYTPA